jgi:hypothetical protein
LRRRYVREWLNSQVAGGYLAYHDESETYASPSEHVPVLADEDSPTFLPPAFEVPASLWFDQERTLEAFRTGDGIPWSDHDARLYCGGAVFYRNAYHAALVPEWLPALDGVVEKLQRGARVADVGCGHGHSTVLVASAFKRAGFHTRDRRTSGSPSRHRPDPARLAAVFNEAGFRSIRRAHETPFNIVLERS